MVKIQPVEQEEMSFESIVDDGRPGAMDDAQQTTDIQRSQ